MTAESSDPDVEAMLDLYPTVAAVLRDRGTLPLDALVAHTTLRHRGGEVDPRHVVRLVAVDPTLVVRPDRRVSWLGEVLDGVVLTHRVRGRTSGRVLWTGVSAAPLFELAVEGPLPLAGGGQVAAGGTDAKTLLGPDGWLPELGPGDLLALRWYDGTLEVTRPTEDDLADAAQQHATRALLLDHWEPEACCPGDPPRTRRATALTHCLGQARLEDPDLLAVPHPPLEELLADVLRAQPPESGPPQLVLLPGGAGPVSARPDANDPQPA
ncbi:hypothetical protein ACFP3Q_14570 [Nocardioides sp. GCM10027113]|uniref:hypothetical protein n=1 Tax=unclassified Nocardioides TaxID=2615069 RepID=UPI003620FBEF